VLQRSAPRALQVTGVRIMAIPSPLRGLSRRAEVRCFGKSMCLWPRQPNP